MPGIIEIPSSQRREEFLNAVTRSRTLHRPWVSPPQTGEAFASYLKRLKHPAYVGYWVRTPRKELAGVININEIVVARSALGILGITPLSRTTAVAT